MLGGPFITKGIIVGPFNYAEQNSYLKIQFRRFWEEIGVEGGLFALQFSWLCKKALELFFFVKMSPLPTF